MEKREKEEEPSEKDLLTISGKAMPIDLFIEIFSRSPAKSIATSRCVSKQWESILRRRDFTDSYLKMSSTRPGLLFTFEVNCKFLFFSAPQPLNPDEQNSSPLVADRHMCFTAEDCSFGLSHPVCGWLSSKDENPMVCNPSTGQYITVPKIATSRTYRMQTHFGYDPIDKRFKVLRVSKDYRVLTLGMGELSWRMIECSTPHCSLPYGICIKGVVYYLAESYGVGSRKPIKPVLLVCFDVKSEKFKFLAGCEPVWESTLINCKGKLGAVCPDSTRYFFGSTKSLKLRVLEDAEKQIWSTHIYILPPLWRNVVGDKMVYIVGMTSTGEFVFSPYYIRGPFYIFYYNVVKNTVVRVEIQLGVVAYEGQNIYTFMDHVEDVKLLDLRRSSRTL